MLTVKEIESRRWVPYAEATHIVVGYFSNEFSDLNGGLLKTASSLEEAEGYAEVYRANKYTSVEVISLHHLEQWQIK